mgnify:CR=1 FL=1
METPSILIVDDEEHVRKNLHEYLSHRIECIIIEAANGYEAIEQLKKCSIDLILLDITMPGISGTEVIKEAKALFKNIAIIVITKWDSAEISNQIKEAGAEYIPKPFSLKVVKTRVEEKLKAIGKFQEKPTYKN